MARSGYDNVAVSAQQGGARQRNGGRRRRSRLRGVGPAPGLSLLWREGGCSGGGLLYGTGTGAAAVVKSLARELTAGENRRQP